jgi:DNA-binding transcriptional ArsR family regulator
MKVKFQHQLTIKYSRVIEALSLICALGNDSDHVDVMDLSDFDDIRAYHTAFFERLKAYPQMRFAWLEFALLSTELDDVPAFIHDIRRQSIEQCLVTLLGYEIGMEDAAKALSTKAEGMSLALSLGLGEPFYELVADFEQILLAFYEVLDAVDVHPSFDAKVKACASAGVYGLWLDRFREGLLDRHPLSYAQELMGKPFWNIADYTRYTFVPVYFSSPYSMRLMNGETMIYIQGIEKKGKSPEEQLENILDPLKSMADGTRLKILRMLYMHPMYGKEIADALGLTTATVSHHLEALYQQRLVNVEKVKQIKYFSTNYTQLGRKLEDVTRYVKEIK